MRVLVLSRGVPCASSPLRGVFELDQAKALAAAGHDVLVGYVDGRSARRVRRFGWSHRTIDGIETLGLDLPLGAVSPELDHQAYRRATGLLHRRVVKLWGSPDVIHAHFSRHAAAVARAGVDDVPLVYTEHFSGLSLDGADRRTEEDVRRAVRRADAVLAVSRPLKDIMDTRYGATCRVVPNVIDVDLVAPPQQDADEAISPLSDSGKGSGSRADAHLVAAGQLVERKGMKPLIEVVGELAAVRPGLTLSVIGDGPQRPELERLAARINAEHPGTIMLEGLLSRPQIAERFARADGFALASQWETFGVVYVEAMAAGLPILATPCGGPSDFLTPDVGMVTRSGSKDDLRAGLGEFLDSLGSWDPAHIRQRAVDRFSPAAVAAELTKVYEDVVPR